jgi:AcrR family transcriptional regulator
MNAFLVDCPDTYYYTLDMSRPRSDEKRSAILEAAARVFVAEGLSAPTAGIAKAAGVANGSLFTYFETKADLFNQLYLELKGEMAATAMQDLPGDNGLREQFLHVWSNWMRWAVRNPEKRRALALLSVSDEITPASRAAGHQTMAGIAALMERGRANGPMRDTPFAFVAALMTSLAEATMDFMVHDPGNADQHCKVGFDALWRILN